jgi:hypothetical protein
LAAAVVHQIMINQRIQPAMAVVAAAHQVALKDLMVALAAAADMVVAQQAPELQVKAIMDLSAYGHGIQVAVVEPVERDLPIQLMEVLALKILF